MMLLPSYAMAATLCSSARSTLFRTLHPAATLPQGSTVAWGWRARLGLAGLMLPLVAHTMGLLWPVMDCYKLRYAQINKVGGACRPRGPSCMRGTCRACVLLGGTGGGGGARGALCPHKRLSHCSVTQMPLLLTTSIHC